MKKRLLNINIGDKFSRLTVLEIFKDNNRTMCRCKCDCGNIIVLRGDSLTRGNTKSCGCIKRKELLGEVFGYLTPLEYLGHKFWLCKCRCGNICKVTSSNLLSGNTKSCGCYRKSKPKDRVDNVFYGRWSGMKARCNNNKDMLYGARGISVCDRWHDFENFKEDMYESYQEHIEKYGKKNTTLDRIDVNGNYCKENCRWATQKEQANNRRTNRLITYKGETHNISEWADILGIQAYTLRARLFKLGWSIDRAFNNS